MRLNEHIYIKGQIVETNADKLPQGVLCRVNYLICNLGQRNANGRVYEKAVWDKVLENDDLQTKIKNRALFGHAEHPAETASDLTLTSHVISSMWIDEKENKVYQTFDILDTPTGRILNTLLLAECMVGCSTRAEGDLEEGEDDQGKFQKVIPEKYKYVTTDCTADPSTFEAIPLNVKRNIVSDTKKELERKDLKENERKYVNEMLNSMKCKNEKCQGCGACNKGNEKKINENTENLLYVGVHVDRLGRDCIVFVYEGRRAETVIVNGEGYASAREEAIEKGQAIAKILKVIFKLGVEESIKEVVDKVNENQIAFTVTPDLENVAVRGDVSQVLINPTIKNTMAKDVHVIVQTNAPIVTEPVPAEPTEPPVELEDEVEELTVEEPEDVESETPEEEEEEVEEAKVKEMSHQEVLMDAIEEYVRNNHEIDFKLIQKKFGKQAEEIVDKLVNLKRLSSHDENGIRVLSLYVDYDAPWVDESKDIKIGDTFKFAGQEYTVVKIGPEIVDVEYIVAYGEQKGRKFRTPWTRKAVEDFINRSVDATESKINETENINKMYQAAGLPVPDGKGIHTEAFHKLAIEVAKGYIKSGDSPEEALKKAYPTAMKQLGKEKAVKKSHQSESQDINSVLKDVTELKIKEATARAEKDAVVEAFSSDKDSDLEVKMLTSRLRKSVNEKNVSSTEVTSLCLMLEKKAEQIKSLSNELVEANKVKGELVKVNKELTAIELTEKSLKNKLTEAKDKVDGANKIIKEEKVNSQQLVKEYIDLKLKSSRLMADMNTRALLESSTTLQQVNDKFDELLDVARTSALHSNEIREIHIPKLVDSQTAKISKAVGSVFESFGYKSQL